MAIIQALSTGLGLILIARSGYLAWILGREYYYSRKVSPAMTIFFAGITSRAVWSLVVPLSVTLPVWAEVWLFFNLIIVVIALEAMYREMK